MPRPGPRHREGHGPDPAPVLRAEGDDQVPRGAGRRRRKVPRPAPAALRRVGARSSARPASSAPRPARSSASTWAASTPRAASTSTGARPRRTASGARNRRSAAPAGRAGPGVRALRRRSTRGRRRDPRRATTTTRSDMLADPRGDPGGLRVPAGRGAQAHQREDRRVVRDDLRHRHLLPPPPLRAAGRRAAQAAAVGRRSPGRETDVSRRRSTRSLAGRPDRGARPERRGLGDGDASCQTPGCDWPRSSCRSGATPRDPTDLDAARPAAGAFDGLRRAIHDLGPAGTIATIEASGLRGRGGAGFPTAREVAAAAATPRRRGATSSPTATAPTRRRAPTGRCSSATRTRVIEGVAIAAYAIGAERGVHRRPRRGHRGGPARSRPRSARPRTPASSATTSLGAGHDIDDRRSGPSRAPTCSARRRSS